MKTAFQIQTDLWKSGWLQDAAGFVQDMEDIFTTSPVASIIVIIGLAASGVLITHYLIKFLENDSDRMLQVIKNCDTITVLMHNNPDPDAMACAMSVKRLAQEENVETQIAYPGRISHDENRAFRAVLDVEFENISHARQIEGEKIVLVDQSKPRGITNGETVIPNVVIDHHDENGVADDEKVEFWHNDSNVGACSSILTSFLGEQDLVDPEAQETKISDNLATALYHGIKSDTNDLSQGVSSVDFRAINTLYNNIDEEKLHRISNPKVDGNSLETKARAIMGREVRGPFAVSDVGDVVNSDAIPQAADELITLEGISAAVVIGTCEDSIRFSGRAYDDRIHLGKALRRAMEKVSPEASAGGHTKIAGGEIPKSELDDSDYTRSDLIEELFGTMEGRV